VDFLGEQALAADLGERAVLHGVAGGGDDVLVEHVHAAQDGAEFSQNFQEMGGLYARQGGASGADFEGQGAAVGGDEGF